MNSVNMVVLSGRLGAPPEEKKTAGSKIMATFRMATNRWDPKTESETADWHSIVCFDKQAELCVKHLTKGSAVLIEGRLVVRQWDGQDGKKQSRSEVIASRVTFLGAPAGARAESHGPGKTALELGEVIPF